jgi:Zn-dependent oligopeptidase
MTQHSTGYYAYSWIEVLAHDAYCFLEQPRPVAPERAAA